MPATYDFLSEENEVRQKRSLKLSDPFKNYFKTYYDVGEEFAILENDSIESRYGYEFHECVFKIKERSIDGKVKRLLAIGDEVRVLEYGKEHKEVFSVKFTEVSEFIYSPMFNEFSIRVPSVSNRKFTWKTKDVHKIEKAVDIKIKDIVNRKKEEKAKRRGKRRAKTM